MFVWPTTTIVDCVMASGDKSDGFDSKGGEPEYLCSNYNLGAKDALMKKLLCFFLGIFAMALATVQACDENGTVYYEGFDVERYFPLSEETIEKYGYKCEISKTNFLSLLQRGQKEFGDATIYEKHDVRVKIIFPRNDVYFISKNGAGRHEKDYFVIDKEKFKKILVSCHNQKQL
jgi:hypothetical protein